MSKEFYTVKEVADILGLSPDRIYEYLRSGYLYGTRLTKNSAWRIPATEIQRLKGTSLEESGAQMGDKPASWSEYLELAIQLQNSVSGIGPKDWAIWWLTDTGNPPQTSEAGLRLWEDRGELAVKLSVELDKRFPLFMTRLKASFTEFHSYDRWRESLTVFIGLCGDMAHKIWTESEAKTGLSLIRYPVMGHGHLMNVPRYIYEFAVDNHASKEQPNLVILENKSGNCWLVPADAHNYHLAMGSLDEMEKCWEATVSLAVRYANDERIGEIVAGARKLRKDAVPYITALSSIIEEAASGS
jgi:excisionase family DNA binding protein